MNGKEELLLFAHFNNLSSCHGSLQLCYNNNNSPSCRILASAAATIAWNQPSDHVQLLINNSVTAYLLILCQFIIIFHKIPTRLVLSQFPAFIGSMMLLIVSNESPAVKHCGKIIKLQVVSTILNGLIMLVWRQWRQSHCLVLYSCRSRL